MIEGTASELHSPMSMALSGPASNVAVESVIRDELAHGNAVIGTIGPIMRHLLTNDEHSVFGDDIVARTRGMFADLVHQLLDALAADEGHTDLPQHPEELSRSLFEQLAAQPALLAHLHGLALEWQLTERMQARLGLDPVLSPLIQSLIASPIGDIAGMGMSLLAAQARFAQTQRRMTLSLVELPGDLAHACLQALRTIAGPERATSAAAAEAVIRAKYDEGRSRLGLISRLLAGMGGSVTSALSLSHAGVAMFLSALALGSGQDRDLTILATNEGQLARLALALRAAGLKPELVGEQFATLHPEFDLPADFEALDADKAASLLSPAADFAGR